MRNLVDRFLREEDGQDTVEYALVIALIALGLVAGSGGVRTSMTGLWGKIAGAIDGVVAAVPAT